MKGSDGLDVIALIHRLQTGTFDDVTSLVEAVLAPLAALDTRVSFGGSSTDSKKSLLRSPWIGDIQKVLLERVLIDWDIALKTDGGWADIVDKWLAPCSHDSDCSEGPEHAIRRHAAAAIALSSLRTCSALMSAKATGSVLHPLTVEAILYTVSNIFKRTSISDLSFGLVTEPNAAVRNLVWKDAVRDIISIPDRAANVTEGKPPLALARRSFLAHVSSQTEQFVFDLSSPGLIVPLKPEQYANAAAVLQKLQDVAYHTELPVTSDPDQSQWTFWGAILRSVLRRGLTSELSSAWLYTLSGFNTNALSSLCRSLLNFLDIVSIKSSQVSLLCTSSELQRPGTEGRSFLSADATKLANLCGQILHFFFPADGRAGASSRVAGTDSGSEDEDDAEHVGVFLDVILPLKLTTLPQWSPLLARSVALWLGRLPTSSYTTVLQREVMLWGSQQRIKSASLLQEMYLSTVLLSTIAQQSAASSEVLASIAVRPELIDGVSAHLDHLDPRFRRFGMLVAEVISSKATEASSAAGYIEGQPKTKVSFGKSLWDGTGEGKEEARVLRALVDGWSVHTALAQNGVLKDWADLLHLRSASPVPRESAVIPADGKDGSRPVPETRRLPARRPPKPAALSAPQQPLLSPGGAFANRTSRPLIQSLSDDEDPRELHSYALPYESSDGSSSSDSDSDDSRSSLGGGDDEVDKASNAEASFGDGMTTATEKKRVKAPVYMYELIPLLRSNDRKEHKVAMKHAEQLVRRKAGWGGEIDESAVEVAVALCGLQNNWKVKDFEVKRTNALTAVLNASPRIAVGCVIEQYFIHQYSIAQRHAMLNALAAASLRLSDPAADRRSTPSNVNRLAEALAGTAVHRARVEGAQHVPAVMQRKGLVLHTKGPKGKSISVVSDAPSGDKISSSLTAGGFSRTMRVPEPYINIASSIFIFPLMVRFRAHLEEACMRSSRAMAGSYGGAGTGALFAPTLVARVLDTLAVLAHAAQNALDFVPNIAPQCIEFSLSVSTMALPLAARYGQFDEGLSGDGRPSVDVATTIFSGAASLALVVLDRSWEIDHARWLRRNRASLLADLNDWAAHIFDAEDAKGATGDREGTAVPTRAARLCAAIVLRVAEIRESWKESGSLLGIEL